MAAHLDLIHLRRHALPVHFTSMVAQPADTLAMPSPLLNRAARSRLVAAWRPGAGGCSVCAGAVDNDDPPLLPA